MIHDLRKIVGDRVFDQPHEKFYARIDRATDVRECLPNLLVKVLSVDELIAIVRTCIAHNTAFVVRGAGTGKSGGAVPARNNVVVVDTTALNRIINIDRENFTAEVEPGVVLADLKAAVLEHGLYYPPDPASFSMCTIGGNVAENAAGPSTVKYGTTRDYLIGGQAILGTGEVIDFGRRTLKGVAGFDIASLLCGSEGTLGIFTKLIVRLLPYPRNRESAIFYFADENSALTASNKILCAGILPVALEYIDEVCLAAINKKMALDFPKETKGALIIECDGATPAHVDDEIALIEKVINVKKTSVERTNLWHMRSLLSEACGEWLGEKISEDIAVPLKEIGEFARRARELSEPPHLVIGLFGHAGDGNLHVQIMFDDVNMRARAQELKQEIIAITLSLRGTITAEHGVGLQKKNLLPLEQSPALINLQKRIKAAFDPGNLINPGKIFDV